MEEHLPIINLISSFFVTFCESRLIRKAWNFLSSIIWKLFFRHFLTAIGTSSAFATLIGFVGKWEAPLFRSENSNLLIAGIVFIALGYTYCQMRSPRKKTIRIRPQFNVTIQQGNLFKEKGVIVIPVNDYFDTKVDDIIVSKKSVHGKFVNKYLQSHTIEELDTIIESKLKDNCKKHSTRNKRIVCNTTSWELGSCIDIELDDNTYVLFAFTKFDSNNVAHLESDKVPSILSSLFAHLSQMASDRPVYMPLFGTGLSRLGKSPKRTLLFYLNCMEYMISDSVKLPGGLTIDIESLTFSDINLNYVDYIHKSNIY